jgi:hypothetical protein
MSKRGDFNPSTNQYFWYLDLPRLKQSLLDQLYHTVLNLRLRKRHELEQAKEILEFAPVSEADQRKREVLENKIELLESSIRRVDNTILLFEKF